MGARLYRHSEERAAKERAIIERFAGRFEQALTELSEGLVKPRARNRVDRVRERTGWIKARSRGLARHYDITVDTDPTGRHATAVRFSRRPRQGSMVTHPGVYCLRTNQTDWDGAALWRTYTTLTDIEAVFRSPNPNSACGPFTTTSPSGPRATCSSPPSPTNSCR